MSEEEKKELPPPSLRRTIWNLLPLIVLSLYLCHYSPSKQPVTQLQQCGKHLHDIGVVIEKDRLLSEDKLYNADLKAVYGSKPIPACPVGGKNTYIEGYTVSPDRKSYLLVCKGDHHKDAGVPSDYPRIAFAVPENASTEEKPAPEQTPAETATPVTGTPTPAVSPEATPKAVVEAEKDESKSENDTKKEQQGKLPKESSTPSSSPQSK